MTKRKTDVTRAVALAALLGGAGCAESGGDVKPTAAGGDPVESAIADLGVPIVGCDSSGFANTTLTLSVDTDPLVLSALGGTFTANGYKCTQTVNSVKKPLKTTDVQQIVINGSANDNKVILDFLPGSFGTKVIAAMGGGIKIDFAANSGAGNDSLMLRASSTAETYRFAAGVVSSGPITDVYVEINADKVADIDIKPSATGTLALTASMGGGNDTVIANPTIGDIDHFGSTAVPMMGPLPATIGLTAYGGPGDDKFTGGFGDDSFFGGDGNDKFFALAGSTTDGKDVYSGDVGDDLVDYSLRTAALKIDVGPVRAASEGDVDLRNPNLYGAAGMLAGKSLTYVIDGTSCSTTFGTAASAPAKPSDITDAINTATNTCLTTTSKVYASLNAKNHLVLMSNTTATNSIVKVESDPGIAATTTGAETIMGLATGAVATLPLVGNVDMTTAALYGGSSTLDTTRLVMLVNGVYVPVTFAASTAPGGAADATAQINTAIDAALGTTKGTWASINASHFLSITVPGSLNVLAGATAVTPTATFAAGPLLGFAKQIEGTVDLTTAGLFAALNSKTIEVVIDGVRVEATYGSAPASAQAVADRINVVANLEFGTTNVVYARVNAANHLVVASTTDVGGISAVRLVGDPAVAAPTGTPTAAEVALGLTVGPGAAKLVGTDLTASGLLAMLATARLELIVNGDYVTIDITAPADVNALLTTINTAINPLGGTASKNSTTNKLEIAANWVRVVTGNVAITTTPANALVGFNAYNNGSGHSDVSDADDGLVDEHDDVRYSTENISSGSGDDVLVGNDMKNTIKGGDGNDIISGGANGATCLATLGDVLQGQGGDDTFVLAMPNCKATLTGGDGDNTADFSGRSAALQLKNNGTADDGEMAGAEGVNIGTDIKKMVGGFGADAITGGASDEIFVGGPGADIIVGGTGDDTMDYSAAPSAVNVTLCFAATLMTCPAANDGTTTGTGEGDQIYQIEHLIGSAFGDTLDGSAATAVQLTIEGGAGDDTITGGGADDTLWGDAGNDTLHGGAGADQISGDAGDDTLDGGDGDQDICLGDGADTHPKVACEL